MAEVGEPVRNGLESAEHGSGDAVLRTLDGEGRVNEEALVTVESELVELGDWAALAGLYSDAAVRAPNAEAGRSLWLSAALVHIQKLNDPHGAEPWLRRVLASDPENLEALSALARAVLDQGRMHEAAFVLEQALHVAPADAKVAIALDLATLVESELGERDRAIAVLLAADGAVEGGREELLSEARKLLVGDHRLLEASDVLEEETRRTLGEAVEALNDDSGSPLDLSQLDSTRVAALAETHRQLGERLLLHAVHHRLARDLLQRARRLGNEGALAMLDNLQAVAQDWEKHAVEARDRGLAARNKREAAAAYMEAAQLYLIYGQDNLRAEEYFDRARLLHPGDTGTLRLLEAIELEAGQHNELLKRLNTMVASARDPEIKVRLLDSAARAAEAQAQLAEYAQDEAGVEAASSSLIDALRRALAVAPDNRELTARLSAVLAGLGQHEARAEVLQRFVAATNNTDLVVETHLELGRIAIEELGDSARARIHFEAALNLRPHNFEAASALRALYKDAHEKPLLLEVLKVLVAFAPDLDSRLVLIEEQLETARDVGREETFLAAKRRFELNANTPGSQEELEKLAEELHRLEDLADAYTTAAKVKTGERARELWRATARLFDERLPRAGRATSAWAQVLECEPSDVEAKEALERHARADDNPTALADILRRHVEDAVEGPEQRLARARLAEVLESRLSCFDEAIDLHEATLSEVPEDAETLRCLTALYRRVERWEDLEGVLARRESLATEADTRLELQIERAEALTQLQRNEEAVELWLHILGLRPDLAVPQLETQLASGVRVAEIARALVPMYRERGSRRSCRDALKMLSEVSEDPEELHRSALEVADLSAALGEFEDALDGLLAAFKTAPHDESILERVVRLAPDTRQTARVGEELATAAQVVENSSVRATILCAAGALHESSEAAQATFKRALEAEPGYPRALELLEANYVADGQHETFAQVLREQFERVSTNEDKIRVGLSLGIVVDERLSDLDGALSAYRQVLEYEPMEPTALARLANRLPAAEHPAELVSVFERMRTQAPDVGSAAALDVRAGEVLRLHLRDPSGAFDRYVRAIAEGGERADAIQGLEALLDDPHIGPRAGQALEPIYTARDDAELLVRALEVQAADDESDDARGARALRISELRAGRLGDAQAAFEGLLAAFEEGVLSPHHHGRLSGLAAEAGALSQLAEVVGRRARALQSEELWRFYARVESEEASRASFAQQGWQEVLQLHPGDPEALEALEKLTAVGDKPEALALVLETRGKNAEDRSEAARFYRRAASIWEDVGHLDAALSALERARGHDETDRSSWQEAARVLGALERFEEQADALRETALRTEAAHARARSFTEEAQVRVGVGQIDRAVDAYENALVTAPESQAAREGLEQLRGGDHGSRAALILEPVYRGAGDWAQLASVYRQLAEVSEDPQERVERWVAIRSIEEDRLANIEGAQEAALKAFLEAPGRKDLLDSLERLSVRVGRATTLPAVIAQASRELEVEIQTELLTRAAQLADAYEIEPLQAVEVWRAAVEAQPTSIAAWGRLAAVLHALDDSKGASEALDECASLTEGNEEQVFKLGAAALIEDVDPRRSLERYRHVLETEPAHSPALAGLRRVTTDPQLLSSALERAVSASSGSIKADYAIELGELRRRRLEQREGAVDAYELVLEAGDKAQQEQAANALEAIAEECREHLPNLAARAAQAIEPILERIGASHRLVQAKEWQCLVADALNRSRLRREIAQVYGQQLGQPDMAFLTLGRVFLDVPEDESLVAELEELAGSAQCTEEWADLNAEAVDRVQDVEVQLRLARRAAKLFEEIPGRGASAIETYERLLKMAPADASALHALERIYRQTGQAQNLLRTHQRALQTEEAGAETEVHHWEAIADLAENELADVEQAEEALLTLKALKPGDFEVLRRLASLGQRTGKLSLAADALETELEYTSDQDGQIRLLLQLGGVYRNIRDLRGAVHSYGRVLEIRRLDPGAMAGLSSILQEADSLEVAAVASEALAPSFKEGGAYEEYAECLERVASGREGEPRKAALLELSDIYQRELRRTEQAFAAVRRAFHEDPDDGTVQERLEELASANGMFEDLAALYLDEADANEHSDRAIRFKRRVAEIYESLGDNARASEVYLQILEVVPHDGEVLEALERLYQASGQFEQLGQIYKRRITQADSDDTRLPWMRSFARLQAERLNDTQGAISTLRRLIGLAPNDVESLKSLAKYLDLEGRTTELSEVLERLLALELEKEEALSIRVRLGRVRAEHMGDLGAADRLLGEALEIDPAHPEARGYLQERFEDAIAASDRSLARTTGEVLARALRAAEDWSGLASVLQLRAGLETRPADRVVLEEEVARIQEEALKEPELAFLTLADTVRSAPGFEQPREHLERLAEQLNFQPQLIDIYSVALKAALDVEVREWLNRRKAQLLEEATPELALQAWQAVLASRSNDSEALDALERINIRLARWAGLTEVLEQRVESVSKEERYPFFLRLAQVWDERLGEPQEALHYYRKAYEVQPASSEVLAALSRLLDPAEDANELADVLERQIDQADDERLKSRLLVRLAHLTGGALESPDSAIALWQAVLAAEPQHPEAHSALEALFEKAGRWQELADLLDERLVRVEDDQDLLRIQRKLGLIKGTRLGSPADAIASWMDILRRNPNDIEALDALRDIHRSTGRWEDLVAVLRKLLPLQGRASGVKNIRFELAEVLHERLGRVDEAIESAKRVLDLEPHTSNELMRLEELFSAANADSEAVRVKIARAEAVETVGERVEILFEVAEIYERRMHRPAGAAAAYSKILELEPDSSRGFDNLARLYRTNGDYRRLVELLDRRLEVVQQAEERLDLLVAIVEVQERKLGHPDLAFGAACRACAEEGADAKVRALAERLAEETGNWDVLAEVYEAQLEGVGAGQALELRRRLGEIYTHQVIDAEQAELHLAWVVAQDVSDVASRRRLRLVYEQSGRWDDVVRLLSAEAEASHNSEDKRRLLFEIAEIEEKQDHAEAAISSIRHALELDPADTKAQTTMARLLRGYGRWPALVQILERRIEGSEGQAKIELCYELAEVIEKGVKDISAAIDAYSEVLVLDSAHRPALDSLERLFVQEEKWMELITVYERRVELTNDKKEAVALLTRISGIWEERFGDLQSAAGTLTRALQVSPRDVSSVIRLERLWRRAGDHGRLLDALGRHVELSSSPEEAISLLMEMGRLYLEHGGNERAAVRVFHNALELNPKSQAVLHALADLSEKRGDWFDALEMLRREVQLVGAEPQAAALYHRIGRINQDQLHEHTAAREAFENALQIDSSYAPALRGLRGLLEAEGQFTEVIDLLGREAQSTRDREEKAQLYYRAAETALDRFDDVRRAIGFLEQGLEAGPKNVDTLQALSDLYFSEERWREAEKLLERQVRLCDPTSDRATLGRLYYRLAYIAEKHGQPDVALSRYHSSYEHDSTFLPTLEGLAGALVEAERWVDAQRIFQAILIQHKSELTDSEIVDIYYQIGDLAYRLGDQNRARKSFERALGLDRHHAPSLATMAALAEREERWEESYEHRERLLHSLVDENERFKVLLDQARLAEERIEEPWRAIDAYVEAKRLRPDDISILQSLVRLYRDTSQVHRALEVLADLASALEQPKERRDVYLQMARINLEQQGNLQNAVKALNTALDIDPSHIEAFSKIEQVLYESRSWSALEENYHRMLKRIPKSQKKGRMVLWRSLADLYTQVLENDEGARIAFEVLHQLDPEDQKVSTALAGLYAKQDNTKPKAAELYLALVGKANDPAVPTRALFNLFFEVGMIDRSFCALGALVLMGAADETERRAYEGLLRYLPAGLARPLTDVQWRKLVFHPHCQNELAPLMSVIYRGAPALFAGRQKNYALRPRRERVDLGDTSKNAPAKLRYFDVWKRLHKVMHVPGVDHYLRADSMDGPRLLPGEPPIIFAGRQNDIFKTASPRKIAWVVGRQMALARPELALVAALDPEEVATCLEAAIRLQIPDGSGVDLGLDPGEVGAWQRQLARLLSDRAKSALREPVALVVQERRMKTLARYMRGVEHSINRAALLVCGDVDVAAKALDDGESLVPDVSHRARIRELMLFVLGAHHFQLREKLGLKVTPQAEEAVRQRT